MGSGEAFGGLELVEEVFGGRGYDRGGLGSVGVNRHTLGVL